MNTNSSWWCLYHNSVGVACLMKAEKVENIMAVGESCLIIAMDCASLIAVSGGRACLIVSIISVSFIILLLLISFIQKCTNNRKNCIVSNDSRGRNAE